MPARWVISPVARVESIIDIDTVRIDRYPKVSGMFDPGRPGKTYQHSSIISDGFGRLGEVDNWCLSLVTGVDLTPLTLDPEVLDVIEATFESLVVMRSSLARTPFNEGWSAAKVTRIRDRLEARAIDSTGLTRTGPPIVDWFERIALRIHTRHNGVRGLHVTERVD